jgi:hypothetical protein
LEQFNYAFSWLNKRRDNIKMRGTTVGGKKTLVCKYMTLFLHVSADGDFLRQNSASKESVKSKGEGHPRTGHEAPEGSVEL